VRYRVMIITLVIAGVLAFSDLTFSSATANQSEVMSNTADHLVINEVYYWPENGSSWHVDETTWWIEIYNPTDRLFNLTSLAYLDIDCDSLPHNNSRISFNPHEYVIFCGSIEKLTALWDIPAGTKMIELDFFGGNASMVIASQDEKGGTYGDYIGIGGEYYPLPSFKHSWARYRGGYDTDNFTNDFYDEPHPTPGYENHLAKGSQGPMGEKTELSFFIGSAVMAVLIASVIWVRYRRRK